MTSHTLPRTVRAVAPSLLAFVLYVATARLGLLFGIVSGNVTLVWPPSGLALALLLLWGFRLLPALSAAAFVATWSTGAPWTFALATAVGNPLEAVVGVLLLRRMGFRPALDDPRDVLALTACAAVATMVSPSVGVTGLCLSGMAPWSLFASIWWKWWLGDGMGVLLVAPLVCLVRERSVWRLSRARVAEAVGAGACLLVISGLALLRWWLPEGSHLSLAFLPFPVLMWIALRFPAPAVALASFVVASFAVHAVARSTGPLADADLHTSLANVWGYLGVIGVSMLLLNVTVDQLRRSRQALAASLTERHQLERRAIEAERLQSIGRLAGGVAHDFNNILCIVYGNLGLARRAFSRRGDVESRLDDIELAADRARDLVKQLLSFARREPLETRVVDLNAVVSDTEPLLRRLLGEHIEIVMDLEPGLARVLADPSQLSQVLINLAANARDAMPAGGTLRLTTRNLEGDDVTAALGTDAGGEPWVQLRVADTGTGMSEEVRRHAFEPFFTTKELDRGTGLGLATCYGIAQQHGGHLTVDSHPDLGTVFSLLLPRHEARGDVVPVRQGPADLPSTRGDETVLVVEDEDMVRALVSSTLRDHGYRVLTAADGLAAIAIIEGSDAAIDLVLTDLRMPRADGFKVGAAVAARRPGAAVVYMTGYADTEHGAALPGARLLRKPFTPDQVLREIRTALDARRRADAANGNR